nr:replication protein A 70 kDa DNA-binding subunit B [Tanacetum cinerariifolium]
MRPGVLTVYFKINKVIEFKLLLRANKLTNVIGTVVSVSDNIPFNKFGWIKLEGPSSLRILGAQLECYFFYSWAAKFQKLHDEREALGHVVMILRLCKVKYFNEKPSVINAMYSTKLFLNDDLPEIAAFRHRYSEREGFDPYNIPLHYFLQVLVGSEGYIRFVPSLYSKLAERKSKMQQVGSLLSVLPADAPPDPQNSNRVNHFLSTGCQPLAAMVL